MTKATAEERIKRTQIKLWQDKPFWAYLSYFLKFQEVKKGMMKCDTMGVDIDGNVYYVKEFVDELSDEELRCVISHELGHLIFLTELRKGARDNDGWNIATDIAINSLLQRDGFQFPKGVGIVPDNNDEILCGFGKKIKNCSSKIAEEIYDELPKITIDKNGNIFVEGHGNNKGKKEQIGKIIDNHIIGTGKNRQGKDGKEDNSLGGLTPSEKSEIEREWKERLIEAHTIAKMKGNVPEGIERLVGKLFESKIDWRALLQRYVINQIPVDYSYSNPHKKSVSISTYLPDEVREKIELAVCIDLSGSVGQEEYGEFISEIIAIVRAFQENISMKFYSHDTDAYDGGLVENGNIEKIMNLKLKGGGGTSHLAVMNKINEDLKDCRAVIFFTDNYSDLNEIDFENYPYNKIFVISKNGTTNGLTDKNCEVIKIED